jgi:hypothetical protein
MQIIIFLIAIIRFLLVMLISVLATTNAFYVLLSGQVDADGLFASPGVALFNTYVMLIFNNGFSLSNIAAGSDITSVPSRIVFAVRFVFTCEFTSIKH